MLNIVSLSVMRDKVTWPGKVVKNLIKGLDLLGYPYVINADLNSTKRLWIHDDVWALSYLGKLQSHVHPIIGPNLFSLPRNAWPDLNLEHIPYVMPCQWITRLWGEFWYRGKMYVWPVGIDTEIFCPENHLNTRSEVLVYIKKRSKEDAKKVTNFLESNHISYRSIEYGAYRESDFLEALSRTRYVIWIGCPETQGIALEEVLACNIPVLVWDVKRLWDWFPSSKRDEEAFTLEESQFTPVTSAEYFDDRCGMKVSSSEEVERAIGFMERNLSQFSPREYILENLSLAWQARAFLELYHSCYGLEFMDGFSEEMQNTKGHFHNRFFWRSLFRIYDSAWFQKIHKILF